MFLSVSSMNHHMEEAAQGAVRLLATSLNDPHQSLLNTSSPQPHIKHPPFQYQAEIALRPESRNQLSQPLLTVTRTTVKRTRKRSLPPNIATKKILIALSYRYLPSLILQAKTLAPY